MRDLVIIGAGPGGYIAALRAQQLGLDVTIVEREALGGTCLNIGCIPTKAYYRSAEVLLNFGKAAEYGIRNTGQPEIDLPQVYQRKNQIVHKLTSGVEQLLRRAKIEICTGTAEILAPDLVQVGSETLKTKNILVATGSRNFSPPIPGLARSRVLDSTALLELQDIPKRLAIIGGGVIGLEFAGIFQAFGSQVTVLEAKSQILSGLDREMVKRLQGFIKKQGIKVLTQAQVQRVEILHTLEVQNQEIQNQAEELCIRYRTPKTEEQLQVDYVLVATGRQPVLTGIPVQKLGLALDGHGFIAVNAQMQTNVPGIYAIGDVIGGYLLAHAASEEGVIAVENMVGIPTQIPYHAVPNCIFTFPELATVGLTEEEAQQQGLAYCKGKANYLANGKALCLGETEGLIKVLADAEGTLIGVHILGAHASDLILEGSLLVKERMTLDQAASTIHPHPVLGEILHEALKDAQEALHRT